MPAPNRNPVVALRADWPSEITLPSLVAVGLRGCLPEVPWQNTDYLREAFPGGAPQGIYPKGHYETRQLKLAHFFKKL